MNSTYGVIFYIAIAIIYATFMSLSVDTIIQDEKDILCNTDSPNYKWKSCRDARNRFDNQKFIMMIVIALLSLILAGITYKYVDEYQIPSLGVGLGSLFIIIFWTIRNWHNLDQNSRLVVLGTSLVVLTYGSIQLAR